LPDFTNWHGQVLTFTYRVGFKIGLNYTETTNLSKEDCSRADGRGDVRGRNGAGKQANPVILLSWPFATHSLSPDQRATFPPQFIRLRPARVRDSTI